VTSKSFGIFPGEDPERFLLRDKIKIHVDEDGRELLRPLRRYPFSKSDGGLLE